MSAKHALPTEFQDLECFSEKWALATEVERNKQRRGSTMEELNEYYEAILPRMDAIITYLNEYPFEQMPEDAKRLLYMGLSLMEISPAIELLGEPDESGVFEAARFNIIDT